MVQLLLPEGPGAGLRAIGPEAPKRTNAASTPWLLQSERRISARRAFTNTFFLTLNTAIFTIIGVFWKD
jgi:hypothetical protein